MGKVVCLKDVGGCKDDRRREFENGATGAWHMTVDRGRRDQRTDPAAGGE